MGSSDGALPEYFFTSDGFRHVTPYLNAFSAHTKRRWIGRRLVDVYASEFVFESRAYYETAIREGQITVNGAVVSPGK